MRLDEWIVQQGILSSRSKAKRFIQEHGVNINGNLITKVAYQVKETDNIIYDQQATINYEKPLGYHKLKQLVSQINTPITQSDICLDIGASVGGYSQFILEQNVQEIVAIEFSSQFRPNLESIKLNYPNFSYIIGDFFKLYVDLPMNYFTFILVDLTIDPLFLMENLRIFQQLISRRHYPTRILITLKLGNIQDKKELILEFGHQIEENFKKIKELRILKSQPKKEEIIFFIEL